MIEENRFVHDRREMQYEKNGTPHFPERRKHPRYRIQHPIEYRFGRNSMTHYGHTVNISEGGLEAAVAEPMDTGKQVDINIHFPSGEDLLEIRASVKVIWADGKAEDDGFYHFGAKLINVSPRGLRHLKNLLNQFSLPDWIL